MTVEVKHNPAKDRYEVLADGRVAGLVTYQLDGDEVRFLHTAVDNAYRGQGLAHQLVGWALADVRAQGKRPVAVCPFVAGVMQRQPEHVG